MAGCKCAGRNKNSGQNKSYINQNRDQVHREQRIKKNAAFMEACKNKVYKIIPGAARMARRALWLKDRKPVGDGFESFKDFEIRCAA